MVFEFLGNFGMAMFGLELASLRLFRLIIIFEFLLILVLEYGVGN